MQGFAENISAHLFSKRGREGKINHRESASPPPIHGGDTHRKPPHMDGRMHNTVRRFATCLVGFSLLVIINAHEMGEKESAFMYLKNSSKGPDKWGSLRPEWQTCNLGKFQSPVDIPKEGVGILSNIGRLGRNYKPAPAVVRNRGHDVMVEWNGNAGDLNVSGKMYNLLQCHWHTPSEHTIHGRRYNMELHMVHNTSEGQVAVVSILYELGNPDPFLEKVIAKMNGSESEKEIDLGVVDPWEIKFGSRKYFRYLGSLTVPPCTQGVIWSLLEKVRTVSRKQIKALRKAHQECFQNNARPLQPLNDRSVYMYRP